MAGWLGAAAAAVVAAAAGWLAAAAAAVVTAAVVVVVVVVVAAAAAAAGLNRWVGGLASESYLIRVGGWVVIRSLAGSQLTKFCQLRTSKHAASAEWGE